MHEVRKLKPWGLLNVGWESSTCKCYPTPVHTLLHTCSVTCHETLAFHRPLTQPVTCIDEKTVSYQQFPWPQLEYWCNYPITFSGATREASVSCACIEFFGEVGHYIERSGFLELCVICEKLMVYRVVSYDIGERCSVQDEENGPQYWALRHTAHELWWWRRRVIYWSGQISVWEIWLKPLECSRLSECPKQSSAWRVKFGGQ